MTREELRRFINSNISALFVILIIAIFIIVLQYTGNIKKDSDNITTFETGSLELIDGVESYLMPDVVCSQITVDALKILGVKVLGDTVNKK